MYDSVYKNLHFFTEVYDVTTIYRTDEPSGGIENGKLDT